MAWPAPELPAEALSNIFLRLRDQEYPDDEDERGGPWFIYEYGFGARWIRPTWVSRSWRDAALQTRGLWTTFAVRLRGDIEDAEVVGAFLGRANGALPLRVYVNWKEDIAAEEESADEEEITDEDSADEEELEDEVSAGALEHLRPWAHRIEFLSINMGPGQLAPVNVFLGTLGPALHVLAVLCSRPHEIDDPAPLNIHGLPNLHTLCIHSWVPPADDTPLPANLTCVLVKETFIEARSLSLLRFLATCTGVEQLFISDGLAFRLENYDPVDLPVIDLPHLQWLSIQEDAPLAAARALTAFRFPPTATFELESYLHKPSESRRLLRTQGWLECILVPNLDDLEVFSGTRSLTLRVDDVPDNVHFVFRLYGHPEVWGSGPYWFLKGTYRGGVDMMAQNRYFRRFLCGLPLVVQPELLTRLELHFADWLPVRRISLWREVFGAFPVLRELVIGGWECIEAATRMLENDIALLPELEMLCLCVKKPPQHRKEQTSQTILRWLTARHEGGTGLRRVEVACRLNTSPHTIQYAHRLMLQVRTQIPSLATEVHQKWACLSCGSGKVGPEKSAGWEWEASSDEESEPDEEGDPEDGDMIPPESDSAISTEYEDDEEGGYASTSGEDESDVVSD